MREDCCGCCDDDKCCEGKEENKTKVKGKRKLNNARVCSDSLTRKKR